MSILLAVAVLAAGLAVWSRLAPEAWYRAGIQLERRLSGLRSEAAVVEGLRIPYCTGGQGEPLLLIHGFAGDRDNFTRIARYLTPHYRLIIPDLPGFGEAARAPEAGYMMTDQVRRLHGLLTQLGIGHVHVGGNSMGGFLAAQYAATHPELVRSVWLLDPAGTLKAYDQPLIHHYEATGEMPLLLQDPRQFDTLIDATTTVRPWLPGFARRALGLRAARDYTLHCELMRQMRISPLLDEQFRAIPAPALVVWGEQDRVLNPEAAGPTAALFRDASIRIMPGIGHLPMLEDPRSTAADYLAWRQTKS
ncbi:alpha/beta fold hydrolase [Massilia sp. TS11]|uniref:alpha/beta fold hydrolase n=1 Tax=Massilia sp. TS11 TaxID=2908003 RepID=UPI001EDC749C|nr:alpha/beta hydrolase [Massilia sp. TS11]MCG2583248.1 alpha/beta hydrolase [Massilia sp. TS11]